MRRLLRILCVAFLYYATSLAYLLAFIWWKDDEDDIHSADGPEMLDISTHVVYEYDTIEVFENQRWLPLSHWVRCYHWLSHVA